MMSGVVMLESFEPRSVCLSEADTVALSGRYRCVQSEGFKIYVDTRDADVGAVVATGRYEPHVSETIRRVVRAGDTFIDLGANIGYYTLMAAAIVGRAGRVIAFEPRPDNVALLRLSLRENGFENVTLHEVAVSDRAQAFKLKPSDVNSLSVVVAASSDHSEAGFIPVRAVALDDVLAGLPAAAVVKMDIDGGELKALHGMQALLRRCRPILLFEFCPDLVEAVGGRQPEVLLEEIQSLDYQLSVLVPGAAPLPMAKVADIVAFRKAARWGHADIVGIPAQS